MGRVRLIEGPVGAGKTTFALELVGKLNVPFFCLDDWMSELFSPDRPTENILEWYRVRKARCIEQIWKLAAAQLARRGDAVLELGLVARADRAAFATRVQAAGYPLTLYLLDAPRQVRRQRVQQRNEQKGPTFSMVVPDAFFDLASDMWEPLSQSEHNTYDVLHIDRAEA